MQKKKKLWIAGIVALISVALLLFAGSAYKRKSELLKTVAYINEIPVAKGEAMLFLNKGTEDENLQEAVESIVWYKILQEKLLDMGKINDISYTNFLEKWEKENASRLLKEKEGQVLYGPIQYTEKVYYEYLMEEYQTMWTESVLVNPTEEQLRKLYQQDDDLFRSFGEVTFSYLSFGGEEFVVKEMEQIQEEIETVLKTGGKFEDVIGSMNLTEEFQERVFTESDLRTPDVSAYPEISEVVHGLEEGAVSSVINLGNQGLIFYCKDRKKGQKRTFEQCKDVLTELYKEEYIKKEMEREREKAIIRYPVTR